jgi:hypothetical protein
MGPVASNHERIICFTLSFKGHVLTFSSKIAALLLPIHWQESDSAREEK